MCTDGIWILLSLRESGNVNSIVKEDAATIVEGVENAISHLFYERYQSIGPRVQHVEVQGLHTTVQNVPD